VSKEVLILYGEDSVDLISASSLELAALTGLYMRYAAGQYAGDRVEPAVRKIVHACDKAGALKLLERRCDHENEGIEFRQLRQPSAGPSGQTGNGRHQRTRKTRSVRTKSR
jgi:hypothetical protein